jgi:CrcB protein
MFIRRIIHVRLLMQIGLVSIGSALGGLARWGITVGSARWFGTGFPWGTFLINISGSLFLGWFATILALRWQDSPGAWLRKEDINLLIAVGFTGAYTTFSTFEFEAAKILRDGSGLLGTIYIAGSVFLGLLAVRLGIALGEQ